MARYDHLPLWHAALKTAVAIERAVARFPRAHKYGLGADLRRQGQRVCALVVRANAARSERAQTVERLVYSVEELKLLVQLGKEIRVYASFAEFEEIARSVVDLGRQSGGWWRKVKPEATSREATQ